MNVIIPSLLIAVAHLATFTLPLGELEKLNISFTCLLAYSVFQLMIVGDMPRSSDNIPLLSYYIDLQMGYLALSLLGEGIAFIAIAHIDDDQVPKQWIFSLMCTISKPLALGDAIPERKEVKIIENIDDGLSMEFNPELDELRLRYAESYRQDQWRFIARVTERLVFITYMFLIIATPTFFFAIYPSIHFGSNG